MVCPHGLSNKRQCRPCWNEYMKNYYASRPEYRAACVRQATEWNKTNRPRRLTILKEYNAAHAEQRGAYDRVYNKTPRRKGRRRELRQIQIYGYAVEQDLHPLYKDKYAAARRLGYRSGLEVQECEKLKRLDIPFVYEPGRLPYAVAETKHYTPDIGLLDNGIVVETKGRFVTSDRKKHKLIKAQYPGLDLRFIFSNPNARISKTSKTTYALWCETNGFKFAAKTIPLEWTREPVNDASLAIIRSLMETK